MRYMLLIYAGEGGDPQPGTPGWDQLMAEYFDFHDAVTSSGVFVAGDPLQPTATATTVRVEGGQTLVTDGPFAETKEQLGGYYILDVPDLDEALRWAARIPTARFGSIEVRPIMDMSQNAPPQR